jgi:hypothetical protein
VTPAPTEERSESTDTPATAAPVTTETPVTAAPETAMPSAGTGTPTVYTHKLHHQIETASLVSLAACCTKRR